MRPAGFEPATLRLRGGCSDQLSYDRVAIGFFCLAYSIFEVLVVRVGVKPTSPFGRGVTARLSRQSRPTHGTPGRLRTCDPLVRSQML